MNSPELSIFKRYLNQTCGVSNGDKILVGVSGGADSMVLLHLLCQCKNEVAVAHCNFNLRGKESDEDEKFVINYCASHQIEIFSRGFDTKGVAAQNGVSIEMAARDLRYNWFIDLMSEHCFRWIAVGHHQDDNIETFFINLIRGTGIRGLSGMPYVSRSIIRPLLAFDRQSLHDYCTTHDIEYRTDSSNHENIFTRNKIRNHVIPVLKSINPSFAHTMQENMSILNEIGHFVESNIQQQMNSLVVEEDDTILISKKMLEEIASPLVVLFELLKDKGFNSSQIKSVTEALKGISGKQFFSHTHRLVADRFNLVITKNEISATDEHYIDSDIEQIDEPLKMHLKRYIKDDTFQFSRNAHCIHVDAQFIEFPLKIRRWKSGDVFKPLGMTNFKKLSDYFIDEKFSIPEKENTWLLISNDDIVWVIGCRLDDRYKITANTKEVIEFKVL